MKKKTLLFLVLLFLLTGFFANQVWARDIADCVDGANECPPIEKCVTQFGEGKWSCYQGCCVSRPQDFIDKYVESLKSETTNVDQWFGGQIKEDTQTGGAVDSLMLKGVTTLMGTPDEEGNLSGGIIGISTVAMSTLFDHPPASGITYFADLLHNAGLAKSAYAQGVGFTGLQPILVIWKVFRNFAYLIITLLFLILGLMIMFRVKLSPQTVISIQSAIPKIVVTLIMITFSYAIAGLLVDLSNLVLIIFIKVLGSTNPPLLDASGTTSEWLNAGVGKVIGASIGTLLASIKFLFGSGGGLGAVIGTLGGVGTVGGAVGIAALIPAVSGALGVAGPILAALAPALIALMLGVLVAILAMIWKIFIMLIKAYVAIILGVVFGPLQIIFDVLPGQKTSAFNSWAKSLLANILVFPTVAILFILSTVFEHVITSPGTALWSPPTLSGDKNMIVLFIKLGILMMIPNIAQMIQQALAVKTSLGSAIGESPLQKPGRFTKGGLAGTTERLGGTWSEKAKGYTGAALPSGPAGFIRGLGRNFGLIR